VTITSDLVQDTAPESTCAFSRIDTPAVPDSSQLHYYARYFGDPVSRLFWRGDELWMGLLAGYGKRFVDLLDSHAIDELFADRLFLGVEYKPTVIVGFEGVWRLDRTPRITYWHEWSPKMWQAGALCLIEILLKLAAQNITLRNPHPWSLLFDGRQFSYANSGSIVQLEAATFGRSYEKIAQFFIRPLLLLENGQEHLARRLTADVREGVRTEDVRHLDCSWAYWKNESEEVPVLPFLEQLYTHVESLQCVAAHHRWHDYFTKDCDFSPGTSWQRKQQTLEAILEDSSVRSVLDLGANTGHYARLAAKNRREVLATDFDPVLVDTIFQHTQDSGPSLYPAVLDFTHPTPGQGVASSWFPPATERFKSDLVLCFALVHHMVLGKYRLDFEQVAQGVRSFTRSRALFEYVGKERLRLHANRPEAEAWYTVEDMANALGRHFDSVEILPPAKDGRQLLICGPRSNSL
jgi:SAM-dependent methyltransferase